MKKDEKSDGTFLACKRCGFCCTLLPKVSFLERLRIWLKGYRNFVENDVKGRKVIKIVNGDCYFLERKNGKTRCKIYEIRPQVCRDFPYRGATECNAYKRKLREKFLN